MLDFDERNPRSDDSDGVWDAADNFSCSKSDISALFDITTVVKDGHPAFAETLVQRRVKTERLVLENGKVKVVEENFIALEEYNDSKVRISQKELRINIIRPCERSLSESKYPCMPSLKLELRDRDYSEPSRDRNKDWKITSKRDIINSVGKEEVDGKQKSTLDLGHYPMGIDPLSSLFWSPGFQSQIRERRIYRAAKVISDTNCIVHIYGLGINGRLLSEGSSAGKLLILEAYSIWNSTKYAIVLSMMQLRMLFSSRPELLRPGKKSVLMKEIVELLYFDYTVSIEPYEDDPDLKLEKGFRQTVSHLDVPNMPPGYPKTVEEMIRVPPKLPENTAAPTAIVVQELKISPALRENGVRQRLQSYVARRLAEEELEKQKLLLYLATPKRKRDLVSWGTKRIRAKMFVLMAFNPPLRPTTIAIEAHCHRESLSLHHTLGLSMVKSHFEIKTDPYKWPKAFLKQQLDQIVNDIKVDLFEEGCSIFRLNVLGTNGPEKDMAKMLSIFPIVKTILSRKVHYALDSIIYETPEEIQREDRSEESSQRKKWKSVSWTSIYCYGSGRHLPSEIYGFPSLRPKREVALGRRLTSRAKRIGGTICMYSLHLRSRLCKLAIPDWKAAKEAAVPLTIAPKSSTKKNRKSSEQGKNGDEDSEEEGDDEDDDEEEEDDEDSGDGEGGSLQPTDSEEGAQALFADSGEDAPNDLDAQSIFFKTLSPYLEVLFRATVPYQTQILGNTIPAKNSYILELDKDKLYELISDRDLLFDALRVSYKVTDQLNKTFGCSDPGTAPTEAADSASFEGAWDSIGICLCSSAVWLPHGFLLKSLDLSTMYDSLQTKSLQEKLLVANSVMHYVAQFVPPCNSTQGDENSAIEDMPLLGWSTVIFSKALRVQSMAPTGPKNVLLQVCVWLRGMVMGVVCFHRDRNDIYFAQPDPDMQRTQIESIRFVEPANRNMFLQTYLSAELVYSEVVNEETEIVRGQVSFGVLEGEGATKSAGMVLDNVVESDYSDLASGLLQKAAEDREKKNVFKKRV